jgi:hypothetical protein
MMNANDSSCISSARKNVGENIKISAKDSLSQHKQKHLIMVLLFFTIFECKTKYHVAGENCSIRHFKICTPCQYYSHKQIKEDEKCMAWGTYGGEVRYI